MAQPLGTVIHALRYLPNVIDLNTIVVGQGPIGQLFCAALRNLGARRIIGIDPVASRLKASPAMGATDVINPDRHDPVEQVRQMTDGAMADLVVEAVGHRSLSINLCIDLCAQRGRILSFGISEANVDGIQWKAMLWKNVTLHASINPEFSRDFPLAMRWIAEGRVDVTPIITHRFALSEIQAAFDTFRERRDGALKVLVEFPAHA
jgi:threonine dehydrogenase-like Zn-dependent dehydrogenase